MTNRSFQLGKQILFYNSPVFLTSRLDSKERFLKSIRRFSTGRQNNTSSTAKLPKFANTHGVEKDYSVSSPPSSVKHEISHLEQDGSEQPSLRHHINIKGSQHQPTPLHRQGASLQMEFQNGKKVLDGNVGSWSWLSEYGPGFAVRGSQVSVIQTPDNFYKILLEKSRTARRRVTLVSLYLGTGKLEHQLVSTLKENMERTPGLQIKVLLDFARGSRGKENSLTMLAPLMERPVFSCQVYFYHTPTLHGARKKILPQRWNELVGIQHMKIYIFDNSVLISGANLSNDYFTNRQDRYFLIEDSSELADFYDGLISSVSTFSFQMDRQNNAQLHSGWTIHPAMGDRKTFMEEARRIVDTYYTSWMSTNYKRLHGLREADTNSSQVKSQVSSSSPTVLDTWIFPLIQMGPFHISYDDQATSKIFQNLEAGSLLRLATGYFNLTPNYIQIIIAQSMAKFEILMAHPKANGFLGAKLPAGGIPAAYTLLATRFFNEVKDSMQAHRISMFEYIRPSWTFHAKGLWFFPADDNLPFVTLIGSPNFGYRSVYRDLETQIYILTTNENLRVALNEEQQRLYEQSDPFGEHVFSRTDRFVPLWIHMVIRFFKNFF